MFSTPVPKENAHKDMHTSSESCSSNSSAVGEDCRTGPGAADVVLSKPGHPRLSAIAMYRPSASAGLLSHVSPAETQAFHFARSRGLKNDGLGTGFPDKSRGSGATVKILKRPYSYETSIN